MIKCKRQFTRVYKVYTNQTNIGLATNIELIDDRTCINFLFAISLINNSLFKGIFTLKVKIRLMVPYVVDSNLKLYYNIIVT